MGSTSSSNSYVKVEELDISALPFSDFLLVCIAVQLHLSSLSQHMAIVDFLRLVVSRVDTWHWSLLYDIG